MKYFILTDSEFKKGFFFHNSERTITQLDQIDEDKPICFVIPNETLKHTYHESFIKNKQNLSKDDILSFADLEQDRFLWARNLEKMGALTPDDIAITGLKFKRKKLVIKGIALTFEDRKDFEIIDEYVQTLRNNKEFSSNFSKIKYVGHSKVNVRGQDIVRFEIEASSKKSRKKNFS